MRERKKRKGEHRALLKSACLAVAFSFVFLCACGAAEPEVTASPSAPSAAETQAPASSGTARPSAAAMAPLPSPSASEAAAEEWELILVNPSHTLPADFSVDLADFEGGQVDARILAVCEEMFADAEADGVDLELVDAYRSRELQSDLFEEKVESYMEKGYGREDAETEATTITARPDTSEHQTGLALDIVTPGPLRIPKRSNGWMKTRPATDLSCGTLATKRKRRA